MGLIFNPASLLYCKYNMVYKVYGALTFIQSVIVTENWWRTFLIADTDADLQSGQLKYTHSSSLCPCNSHGVA